MVLDQTIETPLADEDHEFEAIWQFHNAMRVSRYSFTCRAARSTSYTCQKSTTSAFTGTVSFVRVCSALNEVVMTRRSMIYGTVLRNGIRMTSPGPRIPTNLPR
ncbi:MAG: hypothetical protein LUP97_04195, partial [Methanoregula sp.]|nr:hypothetical protein [Methanoregula sp.]